MSKSNKPNAAVRLYAGLGVDVIELNTLYRRDSSVGAEPVANGRRRTARQHALRLQDFARAGTTPRRKFEKPQHTTVVFGAFRTIEKQKRGVAAL